MSLLWNLTDSDNLQISGYTLLRVDLPSKTKTGGVGIYWKA